MNPSLTRYAILVLVLLLPHWAQADAPDYNNDVKVKTLLRTSINSVGQTIEYPHDAPAEVSILIVEIPPGRQTGWHRHPVPLFGYVLAGQVTVHFADGRKNVYHQGDTLAECVNILHNGVNEGAVTTKLLIFVAGEKKVPFTEKAAVDKDGQPIGK